MGFLENYQTGFTVIVFIFFTVAIILFVPYFNAEISKTDLRGAQTAIAERILYSECLYEKNTVGEPEHLVFNRAFLDANNNGEIPCLKLKGSFYFMKIESPNELTWYFSNAKTNPYIYNSALRGVSRQCTDEYGVKSIAQVIADNPDGYSYAQGKNLFERYGTIREGEKEYSAKISIVVDADSVFESAMYPDGFPLCACDIVCSAEACSCPKSCTNSKAAFGNTCALPAM